MVCVVCVVFSGFCVVCLFYVLFELLFVVMLLAADSWFVAFGLFAVVCLNW